MLWNFNWLYIFTWCKNSFIFQFFLNERYRKYKSMGSLTLIAKRFLNGWSFIVITLGCGVLLITFYVIFFQSDTYAIPNLAYFASIVCAILLILVSGLGLYGLRQQRHCITHNKRNISLGIVRFIFMKAYIYIYIYILILMFYWTDSI